MPHLNLLFYIFQTNRILMVKDIMRNVRDREVEEIRRVECGGIGPMSRMTGRAAAPRVSTKTGFVRDGAEGTADDCRTVVEPRNRGVVHGRRLLHEIVGCKPSCCISKIGRAGRKLHVTTNYFRILKLHAWPLMQYHVEFDTPIDVTRIIRALVYQHRELFCTLFTCTNLKDKIQNDGLEEQSQLRNGDAVVLTIRFVGTISAYEPEIIEVRNMIIGNSMEKLNLQEMSRNFFDSQAKIEIRKFNLEVLPGNNTSIGPHEKDVLLNVDFIHKVLRMDSVYRILKTCFSKTNDFQTSFRKEMTGTEKTKNLYQV